MWGAPDRRDHAATDRDVNRADRLLLGGLLLLLLGGGVVLTNLEGHDLSFFRDTHVGRIGTITGLGGIMLIVWGSFEAMNPRIVQYFNNWKFDDKEKKF